ncbi:hypothetical protein ERO13_D05G296366v2 [Gossypium hirsutum]|nr:hypothetical protein ERO13_D05G296366v2 [Gossypium hirsutum]
MASLPFIFFLSFFIISTTLTAHHLKHPKAKADNTTSSLLRASLFPHSYGGYTISSNLELRLKPFLHYGHWEQPLLVPLHLRYLCSQCAFPNVDPAKIPTFAPKRSSSKKLVGCRNPKCSWLFGPDVASRCQDCEPTSENCTQTCPPYLIQYGLGSTAGLLLVENLPAGIAGFGRSAESLPSQLGLKKFSYCLVSRRFDDTGVSSNMLLETGSGSGDAKTPGLSYTPFYRNQVASNPNFKTRQVPYSYLVPGSDGNGGTIVDSGSTFTFMDRPFPVQRRSQMALPLVNYFSFVGDDKVACLMIVSDNVVGQGSHGGPAIILGSFQQQNYYIEFDMANNRFGWAERRC